MWQAGGVRQVCGLGSVEGGQAVRRGRAARTGKIVRGVATALPYCIFSTVLTAADTGEQSEPAVGRSVVQLGVQNPRKTYGRLSGLKMRHVRPPNSGRGDRQGHQLQPAKIDLDVDRRGVAGRSRGAPGPSGSREIGQITTEQALAVSQTCCGLGPVPGERTHARTRAQPEHESVHHVARPTATYHCRVANASAVARSGQTSRSWTDQV